MTGRSLLHLQCHIGLDTLSWARHGASRVVGLDFSEPAVEVARDLAGELGLSADRTAFVALTDVLDDETGSRIINDYFTRNAWINELSGTYADLDAATAHNRSVEWQHPLGEVVSALAGAGLRIEFLHEHDVSLFQRFESFEVRDGYYRFPADRPRIPLMYSLKARKGHSREG